MKKLMLTVVVSASCAASAATYKLKTNTTAMLLGKDGAVIEQLTLKAGTIVTTSDEESKTQGRRLTLSPMTVAEFKANKPSAGAVFRAQIGPDSHPTYYGIFEGKEKSIVQYRLDVRNEEGDYIAGFTAYVQKNSKIGKQLRAKLTDGHNPIAYVKIRIIKQMGDTDVYLDDVEFL